MLGDPLRLDAEAFAAETPCIAPLVVDSDAVISVRSGEPVQLSWDVSDLPVTVLNRG